MTAGDTLGNALKVADANRIARRHGWLAEAPAEFADAVLSLAILVEVDAEVPLYVVGDNAGGMYGLVRGHASVSLPGADGMRLAHLFQPVSWFGEGPTITGVGRVASITTTRPSTLLFLRSADVQTIVEANPTWWRLFSVPLMAHLRVAMQAVRDLMLRSHEMRIAAVLLRLSGYASCSRVEPELTIEVTHEELGWMANVGRTLTQQTLHGLEASGVIVARYRRITIRRPDRLEAVLAEA